MARAFGATCHKDLTKEVTHVVATKVRRVSFSISTRTNDRDLARNSKG